MKKIVITLFAICSISTILVIGCNNVPTDLKATITKEINSDPGLNIYKGMLKFFKIEINNGYVVIKANCVKYARSQTSSTYKIFGYGRTCKAWLKGAAETAKNVKGIKKVTYRDEADG